MAGQPPSGNGASSFHLRWQLDPNDPMPIVVVSATLEVIVAPARPTLQFWALQVGFSAAGRSLGAAHTGLQWHPQAPEGAVNWGGYEKGGRELAGTASAWPGVDSANTVHWPWQPGRPYRFTVSACAPGWWRSEVTDLTDGRHAVIRDLEVPDGGVADGGVADDGGTGRGLTAPMVWAEVFAPCDDPSTVARWSGLEAGRADGRVTKPLSLVATYQAFEDGGCSNTESSPDGASVLQVTGLPGPRAQSSGHIVPYEAMPPV